MEAEKLELKHLTPYLPYGLRIDYGYKNPKNNTKYNFKLSGLNISKVLLFDEFKPILRPLSDLKQEEFEEIFKYKDEDGTLQMWIDNVHAIFVKFNESIYVYNRLLELHIDLFGLIDKGLAIDINKIGGGK